MSELVSVIVPVYNTENYLEHCIQSIRNQGYRNLEIILVDDGSLDNSGKLCDSLARDDHRVKVIHKENGGLSDARNIGINNARGTYIVFCDSDDWMEKDIIETAVNEAIKTSSQMIIWGYFSDFINEKGDIINSVSSSLAATLETSRINFFEKKEMQGLLGYAWNKLYKRTIIEENGIKFEKGVSLVEDILFNKEVIENCSKVTFINAIGTHYVQRKNLSTLGKAFYNNYVELIEKAAKAKMEIMAHFNCPQERIELIISEYIMMATKIGMLGIINSQCILAEKKQRLNMFALDVKQSKLIQKAKVNTIKDFLLVFVLRTKAFRMNYFYNKGRKEDL